MKAILEKADAEAKKYANKYIGKNKTDAKAES